MNQGPRCPDCHSTILLQAWKPGDRGFCKRCGIPVVVTETGVRRPTKEELMNFTRRGER